MRSHVKSGNTKLITLNRVSRLSFFSDVYIDKTRSLIVTIQIALCHSSLSHNEKKQHDGDYSNSTHMVRIVLRAETMHRLIAALGPIAIPVFDVARHSRRSRANIIAELAARHSARPVRIFVHLNRPRTC